MNNGQMCMATRIRLGLQLFDGPLHNCVCGEDNGKAGVDPLHALSCVKVPTPDVNARHNAVLSKFYEAAVRSGCNAQKEVQSWETQERVDLEIITPTGERI